MRLDSGQGRTIVTRLPFASNPASLPSDTYDYLKMPEAFEGLTPQEIRLIQCAADGEPWTPESLEWTEFDVDPSYAYGWEQRRTLRAQLIRCLVAGGIWPGCEKPWPVHNKGLMVRGAKIDGTLDLDGAAINRTLWFWRCAFTDLILLTDAKCQTLSLRGSYLPFGIGAPRMTAKGSLDLSETMVKGEIGLRGAKIEGQLACDGSHFENPGHCAFDGNAMIVDASVFLRDGFSAKGDFVLRRAKIAGQLSCHNGHFENPGGNALDCNTIIVSADVFLSDGFSATGEIDLTGAKIDGQLDCSAGRFESESGRAINGDTLIVRDSVFLRDGFSINGEINLYRAKIAGNLRFERATLSNPSGDAIDLTLAEIGGGLFFRDLRPAKGQSKGLDGRLILEQAHCRIFSDDRQSWPSAGKLLLDGFIYDRLHDCETTCEARSTWLRLQSGNHLRKSFRPQPWTQAINVLRNMGHDDDARDLAIEREIARSESRDISRSRRAWLWLQRYTTGFGYRPQYALRWSFGVFLISWLVFAAAANLGFMSPRDGSVVAYLATHPGARLPEHYTRFNAPIYAFDNFLPIIELGQDQAWEPSDEQAGHRRITSNDWWVETTRQALGHDWSLSRRGSAVVVPAPDRFAATWARTAADLFHLGFHRFVYWLAEILGWAFVSLYIAGMSGIMKEE